MAGGNGGQVDITVDAPLRFGGMIGVMRSQLSQLSWSSVVPFVGVFLASCGITQLEDQPEDVGAGGSGGIEVTDGTGSTGGWATTAPACQVAEFMVPTGACNPHAITRGHDGNVWFTEWAGNKIGRITPTGTITEFGIPVPQSGAENITAGPDGNVWFSEWGFGFNSDNNIGRITPKGVITEFPINRGVQVWPFGITAGPDGNLWFTEFATAGIGRLSPAGNDLVEYPLSGDRFHSAYDITAGPDGNLWFTDFGTNTIGRITLAGEIIEFSLPTLSPGGIVAGPDGNLWFVESEGSGMSGQGIGRITPDGTITEFPLLAPGSEPFDIASGPDGNLWFADNGRNEIGRISPDGTVVRCPIPTSHSMPQRITLGADGNLWFTEWEGNKIGRIAP